MEDTTAEELLPMYHEALAKIKELEKRIPAWKDAVREPPECGWYTTELYKSCKLFFDGRAWRYPIDIGWRIEHPKWYLFNPIPPLPKEEDENR